VIKSWRVKYFAQRQKKQAESFNVLIAARALVRMVGADQYISRCTVARQ